MASPFAPQTPLYGQQARNAIIFFSRKYGIDPHIPLSVAPWEGGYGGSVGDQGTSFGPFQLHEGGALPPGRDKSWAQSAEGIEYAIRQIAGTIRGYSGPRAVEQLVRGFERPAASYLPGEIAHSISTFQQLAGQGLPYAGPVNPAQGVLGGPAPGAPPSPGATPAPPTPQPVLPGVSPQGLSFLRGQGGTLGHIIGLLSAMQQKPPPMPAQRQLRMPQHGAVGQNDMPASFTTKVVQGMGAQSGGWKYPQMLTADQFHVNPFTNLNFAGHTDWVHVDLGLLQRLNQLAHARGVRITVISGYRSPGYSGGVGGYSTDPHTRGAAVDAYIGGTAIGDMPGWYQLLSRNGLESGAQPNFYRGNRDPEHIQIPGSGVNKSIHARRTYRG